MQRHLAILLLAACSESSTTEIPEVRSDLDRDLAPQISEAEFASLVADNTEFAADLYRLARARDGAANLFMSPHSISIALAMTYAGANGNTAVQMADALHFTLPPTQLHNAFNKLDLDLASRAAQADDTAIPFRLTTANRIFGQEGKTFMQAFLDSLARNYGAGMGVLDFMSDPDGSRQTINHWVEDQTNDKIKDLLPAGVVTPATRLVLTNAIYFAAAWDSPFAAANTQDMPFTTASAGQAVVPFVRGEQDQPYAEGNGYRAIELPYDGKQLSMVVVVPDDLAGFEANLTGQTFNDIVAGMSQAKVAFAMPKFKFDAPLPLRETLQMLGMTDAFSEGIADFSGIDGTRELLITDVRHKGFIAVDERGTEAAAATAVVVGNDSVPAATMTVDKPFVFFIRDIPTGAILFVGRVVDPR